MFKFDLHHSQQKKKPDARKAGGGPSPPPLPEAVSQNGGRPIAEGISGGELIRPSHAPGHKGLRKR